MTVRRFFTGVAVAAVTATTLSVVAPALADPTFVPESTDVVGAGSDTSMYALGYLAEGHAGVPGFNAGRSTGRLVSFDAKTVDATGKQTNSEKVTLVRGAAEITRPNGSGAGKSLLYGAGNNTDVDYARSSSGLSAAEKSAGLQAFPFAKDTLGMAVAASSNAPATLSEADLVKVYSGAVTNWSQIGGKPGVIVPLIPQAGSGTRSFFTGELKRINGGTDVVLAASVKEVQEHDDSPIKGDANAVAPFSAGRAELLGTLRIAPGLEAARALYNVVRQSDVAKKEITDIFGPQGFVCSQAAASLIADAGFEQLLSADQGGACGVATQDSPVLATAAVPTSTALVLSSAAAGELTLTATVAGGGALKPQGTVEFYLNGAAAPAASAIVTGGRAVATLRGQAAGVVTVVARFVPTEGSIFGGSATESLRGEVAGSVTTPPAPAPSATPVTQAPSVTPTTGAPTTGAPTKRVASRVRESFAAAVARGKRAKGTVTVTVASGKKAQGRVVIRSGKKVVGSGVLKKNGTLTVTLKKLARGKRTLVATFTPAKAATDVKGSSLRFTIRQR